MYCLCTTRRWMIPVCCLSRGLCLRKGTRPVRIVVTVSPLMYREVIALSIHDRRPYSEVLLAPPWPTDVRTVRFGPHVLVHDAEGAGPSPALAGGVVCLVEVLYTDSMAARVSLADGGSYTIEDACMDDLIAIVDEAEKLTPLGA